MANLTFYFLEKNEALSDRRDDFPLWGQKTTYMYNCSSRSSFLFWWKRCPSFFLPFRLCSGSISSWTFLCYQVSFLLYIQLLFQIASFISIWTYLIMSVSMIKLSSASPTPTYFSFPDFLERLVCIHCLHFSSSSSLLVSPCPASGLISLPKPICLTSVRY